MSKIYTVNCREVGMDCDFKTEAESLDELMEQCAEHGAAAHDMHGFGSELYIKMRQHVHVVEAESPSG